MNSCAKVCITREKMDHDRDGFPNFCHTMDQFLSLEEICQQSSSLRCRNMQKQIYKEDIEMYNLFSWLGMLHRI